jgi:spore coat polysaccharide biosynthesis protein SpsF
MKNALFVSVRTGSSRLPNKAILKINNRFTIEYLIERLKSVKFTKNIVLCTTTLPQDDILCEIAVKNDIKYFRGSSEDKLQRWMDASDYFNIERFVNADGDDIFYDAPLADLCFQQLLNSNADFIDGSGFYNDVYGIKVEALKKVCEIKDSNETEFIKPYFVESGFFNYEKLQNVPNIYHKTDMRMTLDYEKDFLFFEKVIDSLRENKQYLNFSKILDFLIDNPDVVNINSHLDKDWRENQKKLSKLILKNNV